MQATRIKLIAAIMFKAGFVDAAKGFKERADFYPPRYINYIQQKWEEKILS